MFIRVWIVQLRGQERFSVIRHKPGWFCTAGGHRWTDLREAGFGLTDWQYRLTDLYFFRAKIILIGLELSTEYAEQNGPDMPYFHLKMT